MKKILADYPEPPTTTSKEIIPDFCPLPKLKEDAPQE